MDNIERAIQLVTKATQADEKGDLKGALDNYMEGSQWLLHVLKCKSICLKQQPHNYPFPLSVGKLNEAAHKMIQEKVATYLERSSEIKKLLKEAEEKEAARK